MLKKVCRLTAVLAATSFLLISPLRVYADDVVSDTVVSDYAIVMDADTDQVISSRNADERMYPASMTKMMTAIIAIEEGGDLNATETVTDEMLAGLWEANASVAGFYSGDEPTIMDALYGAALPSGADACNLLAWHTYGGPEAFIARMNSKAAEIGMSSTHFTNVTGLGGDDHYSTARDIAKLLDYCLDNETFRTVFSAHSYTTGPLASNPNGITMHSTFLSYQDNGSYALTGMVGGKSGFTYAAGHCLASWSEINNMHLITVTAHADTGIYEPTHISDTDSILSALTGYEQMQILTAGDSVATVTLKHPFNQTETVTIAAPEDLILDLPTGSIPEVSCSIDPEYTVRNSDQTKTGTLQVTLNGEILYGTDITLKVPKESSFFARIAIWFSDLFH